MSQGPADPASPDRMSPDPVDRDPRRVRLLRWSASGALAVGLHAVALAPFLWITFPAFSDPVRPVLPVELIRLAPGSPGPFSPQPVEPAPQLDRAPDPTPAAPALPPEPRHKPEPTRRARLIEEAQAPMAPPVPVPSPVALPPPESPAPPAAGGSAISAVASLEIPEGPSVAHAQSRSASSAAAAATGKDWRAFLVGRLEQYKRYPPDAQQRRQQGTSYVRFTMDRRGIVIDAELVVSSGDVALDEEALTLPHRSEPLPTPPAGVGGERIQVVVPVQFSLH